MIAWLNYGNESTPETTSQKGDHFVGNYYVKFNEIYKQRVISQTLLKKMGSPEDVAMAVKFLVLDAPFITGHILAVDGGRSISL
jgi:NAD(P)-dependent dehydrogenase (short-subunit alcohol dehydrogenase family)